MRGLTLAEAAIRTHYRVTVIGVKRPQTPFAYASPDTVVGDETLLVGGGAVADVERFAETA